MTEVQNPTPEFLVRVTHPDPNVGMQQIRLDAESKDEAPGAARRWLAGAHNDLKWLDAEAELVGDDGEPEGVGTLEAPPAPDPNEAQLTPGQGGQGGE